MQNHLHFFTGSVVCYDKRIKEEVLGVDKQVLNTQGAVNKEVAEQMVRGALKLMKSDYAIATTGLMGPDGGEENKPVGTVWIAVGNAKKVVSKEYYFRFDRRRNIEITAMHAFNNLRLLILEND